MDCHVPRASVRGRLVETLNSPFDIGLDLRFTIRRYAPNKSREEANMIWKTLGVLCLAAAGAMYLIGDNSSHMSELKDFFWIPLPLGIILLLVGKKKAT